MYYADSLGFLGLPGQPPFVDPDIRLNLVHVTSAPPWLKTMDEVELAHLRFRDALWANTAGSRVQFIKRFSDLRDFSVAETERTRVVFGLQNPPADPDFKRMHELGIRITAIAYDEENAFGSGFKHPEIRLKPAGEKFLEDCLEHRLILDLSHASHQTARDALYIRREGKLNLPIMASHGGCYDVYRHNRNLPDDVLRGIADAGGVVGIATITFLLSFDDDTIEPFEPFGRHLTHAINICGEDAVAIGGDGPYLMQDPDAARKQFEFLKAKLDPDGSFGARFPEHPLELNTPRRMEVIADYMRNGLHIPLRVVEKVAGTNFRWFLRGSGVLDASEIPGLW